MVTGYGFMIWLHSTLILSPETFFKIIKETTKIRKLANIETKVNFKNGLVNESLQGIIC